MQYLNQFIAHGFQFVVNLKCVPSLASQKFPAAQDMHEMCFGGFTY